MDNISIGELLVLILGSNGLVGALSIYFTHRLAMKKLKREQNIALEKAKVEREKLTGGYYDKFVDRLMQDRSRNDNRYHNLELILEKVRQELEESRDRENELEKKTAQQDLEIKYLQQQISLMAAGDDDSPYPLAFINTANKLQAHNEAFHYMFARPNGYNMKDYIGEDVDKLIPKERADDIVENILGRKYKQGDFFISKNGIKVADDSIADVWRLSYWPKFAGGLLLGINVQAVPVIN